MSDTAAGGKQRIWPVLIASALGLAILIGLGTWQLQRKTLKEGLIAQIAARTTEAPVGLEEAERRWVAGEDIEYLRVAIPGRFIEGRDNYYFTTGPAGPGYQVYAPFRSGTGRTLLANRGYIPVALLPRDADTVMPRPTGDIVITGLVRASEDPGLFDGEPPPEGRNGPWLFRSLSGMAAVARIPDVVSPKLMVPFFLDLERDAAHPEAYPLAGTTRLALPNRHLEYALTWYGLAATLAVITGFFVWSRRRGG